MLILTGLASCFRCPLGALGLRFQESRSCNHRPEAAIQLHRLAYHWKIASASFVQAMEIHFPDLSYPQSQLLCLETKGV